MDAIAESDGEQPPGRVHRDDDVRVLRAGRCQVADRLPVLPVPVVGGDLNQVDARERQVAGDGEHLARPAGAGEGDDLAQRLALLSLNGVKQNAIDAWRLLEAG